jgi:hypothetical protein
MYRDRLAAIQWKMRMINRTESELKQYLRKNGRILTTNAAFGGPILGRKFR